MKYTKILCEQDINLAKAFVEEFVPNEIFDIHTHPYNSIHFPKGEWSFLDGIEVLGCKDHRNALKRYMPSQTIHGLYFGMPRKSANRKAINKWIESEVLSNGTELSRALMLVSPQDDPKLVAAELRKGFFCGIKVYHCYAPREVTMDASITEYAPEWMWEILHEISGIMVLHIVKDDAIEDQENQHEIRRLCRSYPKMQLILAHVARSFNYRHARNGLNALSDIDNIVVDTSAICEASTFQAALESLDPTRILWGSDFAVSELRGRCITTGSNFHWLHPEAISPTPNSMTLVGIESLICLREACEDKGLNRTDIENIFLNNALRLLKPWLPQEKIPIEKSGPETWQHARNVISGGSGLLSKRSEMFDPEHWPSYFSKCSGCEVWDLEGRRYIDFAGGIGAVLLGYADSDVTAAIHRRLLLGTYCSLNNPQEVELADLLLKLHPWAGKVKYARGGGDAMAMAVRIARAATGKSGIAFCGYHGWHDWYLAANIGETNALDGHLLPGLEPVGVPRELKGTSVPFKYNDIESFEKALTRLGNNFAAVVMEPMRSQEPQNDFLSKIKDKCHATGAVFIVDEITSGLRYGFPGALSRLNIDPDIVVYAKAMSNGIPFATVIGKDVIMNAANNSFISSSYWTDGIGTAAALATLKKMQYLDIHNTVWQLGLQFQQSLKELVALYPACKIQVSGMPVSPSFTFNLGELSTAAKNSYIRKMSEKGFLVSSIYYLMFTHQDLHIKALLEALNTVLKELEELIINDKLHVIANNNETQQGFARLT